MKPSKGVGGVEVPLLVDDGPKLQSSTAEESHPKTDIPISKAHVIETSQSDTESLRQRYIVPRVEDGLPTYTETEEGNSGLQALLAAVAAPEGGLLDPRVRDDVISRRTSTYDHAASPLAKSEIVRQKVVRAFFHAIDNHQDDVVALFIDSKLVTASTTNADGKTPLLAAVAAQDIRIVQELIDFGADPDDFGIESKKPSTRFRPAIYIHRTPLQLAASMGNLTLVKLLVDCYHCSDALIAPDGQLALRLAASNGHREIVAFLPARRGGGWRRWKTHHEVAMRRINASLHNTYLFFKVLCWHIPKFLLWSVPQDCLFRPIARRCNYCWKHRHAFLPWLSAQARLLPTRFAAASRHIYRGVRKIPAALATAAKAAWKFSTRTLPLSLKRLFVEHLPRIASVVAQQLWRGFCLLGTSLLAVLGKLASLIHTAVAALVSFFRHLTLKDIYNGVVDFLRAVVVTFPRALRVFFSETSYEMLEKAFGVVGEVAWWVVFVGGWVAAYVPRRLWEVVCSLGGMVRKAGEEGLVWVNPKA